MHSRPKSSAEILATAKRASKKEIQPRKSKTERDQPFKDRFSTLIFNGNAVPDVPAAGSSSSSRPANVHGLSNIRFKDPTTPHTLEAAPEIKKGRNVMPVVEDIPDLLVGDDLGLPSTTWVPLIRFNI